jgi:RimJ/RimL family protein N-acetyltransferase
MTDICLTPFRLDDAPLLMEIDRDRDCARWFDFPEMTMDEAAHRAHAEGVLQRWAKEAAESSAYHLAIRIGERPIGVVALRQIAESTAGMSYAIIAAERGRGYATRAAELMAKRGFEELGYTRIELRTDFENVASQRVAERAGFTFVRVHRAAHRFKHYLPFVDEERDEWVYELKKPPP